MKKYYKEPTIHQVKAGKILPIYLNYKDQEGLLGYAMLNHKVKGSGLPYVRAEIGGNGSKEGDTIIWSWRRYNITYVDPWKYDKKIPEEERKKYLNRVGFTTNWNISFFVMVSSITAS
jgi:hypothetical protein